jgi:WS/DGAT/MGAT family acyltransferase
VGTTIFKTLMRAGGLMKEPAAPLPFSAPHTMFNQPVHATRRLGLGTLELPPFLAIARQTGVTVNDVALTLVGAALERYATDHGALLDKPLVAACPMGIRKEGDTDASTQIAAISVKLGEPGAGLRDRLVQVNESAAEAKQDAKNMSREGLINYLVLIGGLADLLDRSVLGNYVPPLTNVNVSNVAGSPETYYLSGAKLARSYPISTLAGGTVINITFFSTSGMMDYAIITDAKVIPDADKIADYMAEAFAALVEEVAPEGS